MFNGEEVCLEATVLHSDSKEALDCIMRYCQANFHRDFQSEVDDYGWMAYRLHIGDLSRSQCDQLFDYIEEIGLNITDA